MITSIGPHKVQCANVMHGIDNLMGSDVADFCYSDPPWGQGNLKYWQTINKRHTGQEPQEISYAEFMPFFFALLNRYVRDIAIIEYGQQWHSDVIEAGERAGFRHGGDCVSFYKAGSKLLPVDVHVFSKSGTAKVTQEFARGCKEYRGQRLVEFAFDQMLPANAKMVLDPMCGMGYTAQATVNRRLAFRGNELNAKRLQKTIARLEKSVAKG